MNDYGPFLAAFGIAIGSCVQAFHAVGTSIEVRKRNDGDRTRFVLRSVNALVISWAVISFCTGWFAFNYAQKLWSDAISFTAVVGGTLLVACVISKYLRPPASTGETPGEKAVPDGPERGV
ncbi:hypothetical protein WKY82_10340 [Gordonia malaquae]|uniref:hypothetical protein n=1 Tax=Gordonia malaquae TaxID=410332 RepID=UPI0030C79427